MTRRAGDCRHCGAPEPLEGTAAHAWDCPVNGPYPRFDWDVKQRGGVYIPDTVFIPLPPLATLDVEEKAALFALARQIARGWEQQQRKTP